MSPSSSQSSCSTDYQQESQKLQGRPQFDAQVRTDDDLRRRQNDDHSVQGRRTTIHASQQSAEISDEDEELPLAHPTSRVSVINEHHTQTYSRKRSFEATDDDSDDDSAPIQQDELPVIQQVVVSSPMSKKIKMTRIGVVPKTKAAQNKKTKAEIVAIAQAAADAYESIYAAYSSTHDKYNAAKKREERTNKQLAVSLKANTSLQTKLVNAKQSTEKYKKLSSDLDESLGRNKKLLARSEASKDRTEKDLKALEAKYVKSELELNKMKQTAIVTAEEEKTRRKALEGQIKDNAAMTLQEVNERKHNLSLKSSAKREQMRLDSKAADLEKKKQVKQQRFSAMFANGGFHLGGSMGLSSASYSPTDRLARGFASHVPGFGKMSNA